MQIARLDNGVFFKKVFTDKIVFKAFVKDILGIDVNPKVIETEKSFQPKLGNIDFKFRSIHAPSFLRSAIFWARSLEFFD